MKVTLATRTYDTAAASRLRSEGYSPPMSRVLAARQVRSRADMDTALSGLIPPSALPGAVEAASILADALEAAKTITIVGDYDCDGATACGAAYKGLLMLGFAKSRVSCFIPDRLSMGYGLTPAAVKRLCEKLGRPDIILTVDNGTGSLDGVAEAKRQGIDVIVTDHHLPGEEMPGALCIVNPYCGGTGVLRNLAGVGVMFYVLIALRAELRRRGRMDSTSQPNLSALLDLVALGTAADVVPLDRNNRIIVAQGLERLRRRIGSAGLSALFEVAVQGRRTIDQATVRDLSFTLAPRINAAGRLYTMETGLDCLLAGEGDAVRIARTLDGINQERKSKEKRMQDEAQQLLDGIAGLASKMSLTLHRENWHPGLVGLVASRVKERINRPVIAFAPVGEGLLRGSGRSISGIHLRDCLREIEAGHPGMLVRYGGHALAAGVTVKADRYAEFSESFEEAVSSRMKPDLLTEVIPVDGALAPEEIDFTLISEIDSIVWGQQFDAPLFANVFRVRQQKGLSGGEHLKATVETAGHTFEAVYFRRRDPLPEKVKLAYRPGVNDWMGKTSLQLVVEHAEE